MSPSRDWTIPPAAWPKVEDYGYDLDRALASVVGLRATIPEDAFTATTLGTERAGNGVVIREDGVILTIGYLITEAEEVWLTTSEGNTVPAHVLAYDQVTGFGLVQALAHLQLPALPLGRSGSIQPGERVVVAGAGGRRHGVAARILAKQEFAGYWEYVLDEAIFTAPAHPNWGGTGLIGPAGDLLGIGSLHLQQAGAKGPIDLNMIVPIDLLKPILDDLFRLGRQDRPPRPWLGLYATEVDDRVLVMGLAADGPADRAGIEIGDLIVSVAGEDVDSLAGLFRRVWSLGHAGVEVPLSVYREGHTLALSLSSADRNRFLKTPRLH
jgi:S1-C subfamily serine protease